ncbi:MAG: deoxyribose-phosphate aldolase [Bacteroidales bacterium]|jgi:deoxyribose-phosphate aldolase|nr:deoxyribose-phosphate aldolase [Bacteroidales bacterium]
MNYSEKYGYTPDRDAIGRAIEMIAANMENIATEQVYKDCFSMMDLTTLKTDDTPASVTKLVEKVNVFHNTFPEWPYPASVCVFSNFASTVKNVRKGDFNITVVSACFPSSQSFLEVKLKEVEMAVEQGADEVDIVLALNAFLADDYDAASEEIRQVRRVIDETAGKQGRKVHLKVILETGLLKTPENIAEASFLAMEAGADFIKTSTGKVDVNATPLAAYIMCECIAKYYAATGKKIGFKPAGGISSAADALCYYSIVASLLGKEWLNKELFRFGVSRVANSILSAVEQKTVSYF